MSRLAKWKHEKIKVKVVFRLQFHATHVPPSGWDKLFISFIPVDSGKATAKTTKANVRNGICKWGDPIYETTRLLQDAKTKQYDEKLCRLVVMMGTSRSSILGEATINLAEYAEALKPSTVALPLHGCDSGTTLNVTIQLLTSKTGFREFEQQRELTDNGAQRAANQNSHDNGTGKGSFSEEIHNDRTDKVNARVRFKSQPKEIAAFEEIGVSDYVDLAAGCDVSSNASESLHTEKHDMISSHEVDSIKSTVSGDVGGNSSTHSPRLLKGDSSELLRQASSEWIHGWSSDYSVDNELVTAKEDNSKLRGSLEVEECNIIQIKTDVLLLQNYADELCSDTQKFASQLASELLLGQDLRKEVWMLKSECSQLKEDLERLKAVKFSFSREKPLSEQDQPFHNIKLRWLEGLLLIENKVKELQKKANIRFQESDYSFIGSDLEILLSALHELKQINGSESGFQSPIAAGFVSCGADSLDVNNALRDKIFELLRELDESKAEGESLARKMDQMECYYENLIHELEENQKIMVSELHNLRNEHSTCVYTLSVSKSQMETMNQDFSEQLARYAEDRRELDELNKELEKRLTSSETALKRARLNYSIAVDQLQKDLETLSLQIISMHQTNESLIKQAFPNPPQRCFYDDPEIQQGMNASDAVEQLQHHYKGREVHKQPIGRDMVYVDLKTSLQFQEQFYHKVEEEVSELQLKNLELDIFATALQETLLEVSGRVVCMNDAADKLFQQFVFAINSREFLTRRLQSTENDLQALNDFKNSCIANCEKVDLLNQTLEAKSESLTCQNLLLSQKIQENESAVREFRVYKEKYEACEAERNNLGKLLRQEYVANENHTSEISAVHEKLSYSEDKCLELASQIQDMNETISFFENKVSCMLQSYSEKFHDLALSVPHEHPEEKLGMDLRMIMGQLELSQNDASDKLQVLMDENRQLMEEREIAVASLNMKNSEVLCLKKKLRDDLVDIYSSLQKSDAIVLQLQLEIEAFTERTMVSSDTEVINGLQEFLSYLETQVHSITSAHDNFAQEVLALENVAEELNMSQKVLAELKKENQSIKGTLQETTNQSMKLKAELDVVEENMKAMQKELHLERCQCGKLESQVAALTHKLNEASNQLTGFEQKLRELEAIAERLVISFKFEEKLSQHEDEIANEFSVIEAQLKDVTLEGKVLAADILALQTTNEDLEGCKLTVYELKQRNEVLAKSLQERVDVSMQLEAEILTFKEKLEVLSHELNSERDCKTKLESVVANISLAKETLVVSSQEKADEILKLEAQISTLTKKIENLDHELNYTKELKQRVESRAAELTCQLNEKNNELLDFDQQKDALAQLTQQVLYLESEKSRLSLLLKNHEDGVLAHEKLSSAADLEINELHGLLLAEDVKVSFLHTQYESSSFELINQLKLVYGQNEALQNKCLRLDTTLNECLARETSLVDDNATLYNKLESLKSDLEASVAQNQILLQSQRTMQEKIGIDKDEVASLELLLPTKDNDQHIVNVQERSISFESSENQTDSLLSLSEMLSIQVLVLKSKLNEMLPQFTLLGTFKDEVTKLKVQCTDLTHRLSEESMKAEEFKNLSVHFKELKDKAEAKCARAFEKNELEGLTMARQDSLRVAFIKEQCETQVQELKQQLCISKKHSDEMLWKLQDAINETESRKKSEASYLKKIDELSTKNLQLETELERALSDKREKAMDIDRMQAELDCCLISLECFKEEKQKIEALLLQREVKMAKCEDELASVREELKCCIDRSNLLKESDNATNEANDPCGIARSHREMSVDKFLRKEDTYDVEPQSLDQDNKSISFPCEDDSKEKLHAQQQMQVYRSDQSIVLGNGVKNFDCTTQQLRTQSLRSSMEHLQNELEKMKRENSDLEDSGIREPTAVDLQKEIMLLDKANEELGSRYPFYNEFTDNGNALERVLALELELAEALQAKKKSAFNFQSSFLKMHSDEDAVFKSFRDINELIKEMLEIKGRYSSVENELNEMHERYSQLSLQFAEVEGERQKLTMMLKNVRGSKRNLFLDRSGSPPILADSSP